MVIYGLVDPREPTLVRYVGKSADEEGRRRGHSRPPHRSWRTELAEWKRRLHADGIVPTFLVIQRDIPDEAELADREVYWIHTLRQEGHPLLNMNDGGSGPSHVRDEVRERISNTLKGRILPASVRKKISVAKTGNTAWLGKTHSDDSKRKMSESAPRGWQTRYRNMAVRELRACFRNPFRDDPAPHAGSMSIPPLTVELCLRQEERQAGMKAQAR